MWIKVHHIGGTQANRTKTYRYLNVDSAAELFASNTEIDGFTVVLNRPGVTSQTLLASGFVTLEQAQGALDEFMDEQGWERFPQPSEDEELGALDAEAQIEVRQAEERAEAKASVQPVEPKER